MPQLVFLDQPFKDRSYDLALAKTSVGRAADNTLVIVDASVSSHHCEILTGGDEVIIHDLNSTNGTFINDLRVKKTVLRDGEIVRFGNISACLKLSGKSSQESPTCVTAIHGITQLMRQADKKTGEVHQTFSADTENIARQNAPTTSVPAKPAAAPITAMTSPPPMVSTPTPSAPPKPAKSGTPYILIGVVILVVAAVVFYLLRK